MCITQFPSVSRQKFWNHFDTDEYVSKNFLSLHEEDKMIIRYMSQWYDKLPSVNDGLEVGIGPNLYPVMAMLPVVRSVTAIDINKRNIEYIRSQQEKLTAQWNMYWLEFQKNSIAYSCDCQQYLKSKLSLVCADIYGFSPGIQFDVVSMNSFAESIVSDYREFVGVCRNVIQHVKLHGYISCVFMEKSTGYTVGNDTYPAVSITQEHIVRIFTPYLKNIQCRRIPKSSQPLREGYSGMIHLTGQRSQ